MTINKFVVGQVVKDKYDLQLSTQKFIIQTCWAQHDAQWFLKSKKEMGIREANELNQNVLMSMGKIEARHVLNALGINKNSINSMSEVFKVMNTFMYVLFPNIMKFKFIVNSKTEGIGIVKDCFIWKMVEKSNEKEQYSCACNFRHRGWLKAMGIDGDIIPISRISHGDKTCEFKFVLKDN